MAVQVLKATTLQTKKGQAYTKAVIRVTLQDEKTTASGKRKKAK